MKRKETIDTIAGVLKHFVYSGVVITLAWLTLCGVIVSATGSTDGIDDAGTATVCLVRAAITEPTEAVAQLLQRTDDRRAGDDEGFECLGDVPRST